MSEEELPVSHRVLQAELRHLQVDVEELKTNQKEMIKELSRYRGVVGGAMLVLSAVGAAIGLIIQYIKVKV